MVSRFPIKFVNSKRFRLYDSQFYETKTADVSRSAGVVVNLLYEDIRPQKVVDVGCGHGEWLRAFYENGVRTLCGLDGVHIDRSKLVFEAFEFVPIDLSQPFEIPGIYDLAICLEVAEHLPITRSRQLIESLVRAAPIVLFSAAVPGQGGTGHVNEQWPEYWQDLFASLGYRMVDAIRPQIRDDERVKWWYRQNILLFASETALTLHPRLTSIPAPARAIEWLHINMLREVPVKSLMRHLAPAIVKALRRRIPLSARRSRLGSDAK
jgi:SAM-dependent methyltransferase